ncbi:hypothetical protein JOC54_004003 [Alkalihalobacillus xiaoxiensis]|uniref:Uncharacterized protein n=1 Tax=Shouchella xiaoxiensis TaxID=766895 RepID=A0ABS2SZN5_9BACI|nr:hypothetical protein [Shouchella xiaoxiensis]MBM7840710.1 hypothetical protein [Shouchella xiaoxiensis]
MLSGIRTGVTTLQFRYPLLVDELRPYIDSLLFDGFAFYNVHLYNSSANSILKEMQIVFEDVGVQLSEHEADFVNVLEEKAKQVKSNMNVLELQVERGTFL